MANEYTVNQADLVAVANAIRERSGVSDSLVFPNGFAEAIANISGLPSGISALATGTYTFASDKTNAVTRITHDLGVAPHFYVFYKQDKWTPSTSVKKILYTVFFNKSIKSGSSGYSGNMWICGRYIGATSTATLSIDTGIGDGLVTVDTTTFGVYSPSGYTFVGGDTFNWICGVFETK